MGPLRQRLEMIDSLSGFDLDDRLNSLAPFLGVKHEVRIERRWPAANRGVLLGSRVYLCLIASPTPRLQETDDTIVLELFANGPDEDGAHRTPPYFDWLRALGAGRRANDRKIRSTKPLSVTWVCQSRSQTVSSVTINACLR